MDNQNNDLKPDEIKPEEIIKLFKKTVYENTFGTVGVVVSRETTIDSVSHLSTKASVLV